MSSYPAGSRPSKPVIYNVTMTEADTEYSQILGEGCLTFLIHTRDESSFRLAFEAGKVATPVEPYFTVPANSGYSEFEITNDFLPDDIITLYFASDSSGKVIEIIEWT